MLIYIMGSCGEMPRTPPQLVDAPIEDDPADYWDDSDDGTLGECLACGATYVIEEMQTCGVCSETLCPECIPGHEQGCEEIADEDRSARVT